MRVLDIPLPDIAHRYLKIDDIQRDGNSNRYKVRCPFPQHSGEDKNPSLIFFDKTDEGKGWDYHCFTCGAHGTAPTMLTVMGITQDEEEAFSLLEHDYDLNPTGLVTLKQFSDYKGLDIKYLKDQGWTDSDKGIVIPVYDTKGDTVCEKIRVKYSGKDKYIFRSTGSAAHNIPYGLHWLDAYEPDVLYLTEGETDCITLRQAGFPAIGIMGAKGFSPAYIPYFAAFSSIILVRDNDAAGWELTCDLGEAFPDKLYMVALPKGTKDVNNYHQYRCNADISLFKTLFAELPVLPATPDSFIASVKDGLDPTETACWQMVAQYKRNRADLLYYKDVFCKATKVSKAVVTACLSGVSVKPEDTGEKDNKDFLIDNNCYYKQVFYNGRIVQEKISNFIVTPQYDINTDGDIIRVCELTNVYGRTASGVHFDAEALSAAGKFNARCLSAGDYIFTGAQEDLFQLCTMIFATPKRTVHSPRRIGRLDTGGWLFGNCGIEASGELIPMDDGIVLMDGIAYSPRSITVDDDGNTADLPTYDFTAESVDIGRVARDFRGSFGTPAAWLALGWCVAGWFSDAIFDKFGFYPYLFVTGKRSSGKSVMCTMLQSAFGFSASAAGMSIESPTNVGVLRYLGYRSSMPQWYDDYRNDVKRIKQKDGLLLDVYNRHGALKGVRDGSSIRQEKISGYLLLSGEDTPDNNALLTRCVVVELSAYDRDPKYFLDAQDGMKRLANYAATKWAVASTRGETAALIASIDKCYSEIFRRCGDARYAGNNAIFMGAFLWAFADVVPASEIASFSEYVYGNSAKTTAELNTEHPMAQFFNEFPGMIMSGLLRPDEHYKLLDTPRRIALRIGDCHKIWNDYHRGAAPISKKTLKGYIEKEPFYVGDDRPYFDSAGRQRCSVLMLSKMSDEFPDFVSMLEEQFRSPAY